MRARAKPVISIALITVAAVIVAYYTALPGFNLSRLSSADADEAAWEAEYIRSHVPVRLVQPEWLEKGPDLFFRWVTAETLARLGVVCALWIGGVALTIWREVKLR